MEDELNLQLLVMVFGQELNVVISKPELPSQGTKALLILSPVSVKVLTAALSALEDLEWKCMNLLSINLIGSVVCVKQNQLSARSYRFIKFSISFCNELICVG